MFVGFVWLTSNYMFGSDNFGDKSPSRFLKILKLSLFHLGNFKTFKNKLGQFIPNWPAKHVITSTNTKNVTCFSRQNRTKMKFFIKDFLSKCDQIQQSTADLVTYTEEILNGKLHFLRRATKLHDIYALS